MFHVKHPWQKAAAYVGLTVSAHQIEQMERFGVWLVTEAVQAGGIGPNETKRVGTRHLADSLLFASVLNTAESIWDLGTGVGLPGVPLAILKPETSFQLIDRSRRRTDLLRRLIRILDLENCQVIQREIADLSGTTDAIVARASLPPDEMATVAISLLNPGGVVVLGGSWTKQPDHEGWVAKEIPASVLDQTVWLLMMRRP